MPEVTRTVTGYRVEWFKTRLETRDFSTKPEALAFAWRKAGKRGYVIDSTGANHG